MKKKHAGVPASTASWMRSGAAAARAPLPARAIGQLRVNKAKVEKKLGAWIRSKSSRLEAVRRTVRQALLRRGDRRRCTLRCVRQWARSTHVCANVRPHVLPRHRMCDEVTLHIFAHVSNVRVERACRTAQAASTRTRGDVIGRLRRLQRQQPALSSRYLRGTAFGCSHGFHVSCMAAVQGALAVMNSDSDRDDDRRQGWQLL